MIPKCVLLCLFTLSVTLSLTLTLEQALAFQSGQSTYSDLYFDALEKNNKISDGEKPVDKKKSYGILVVYKADNETIQKLDSLQKKFGLALKESNLAIKKDMDNLQVYTLKEKDLSIQKENELYQNACKEIEKIKNVRLCELNKKVKKKAPVINSTPLESAMCELPTPETIISNLQQISSGIANNLGINCSLPSSNNILPLVKLFATQKTDEYGLKEDDKSQLSPNWAKERTGADLAKNFLKELNSTTTENMLVLDDFDPDESPSHGKFVSSIYEQESYRADSSKIPNVNIEYSTDNTRFVINLQHGHKKILPGTVINYSMDASSKSDLFAFGHLKKNFGAIPVIASGNDAPFDLYENEKEIADRNLGLMVGADSPYGHNANFSQRSNRVTITAPGDDVLYTYKDKSGSIKNHQTDGTSFSAPKVSAAIANAQTLLKNHLRLEDAKILLEKTAIPTLGKLAGSETSGAGMLNSYKMIAVAKKISDHCSAQVQTNTQTSLKKCIKESIKDDSFYAFENSGASLSEAKAALPGCADPNGAITVAKSCSEQKAIMDNLRKDLFLNPDSFEIMDCLAGVYKKQGFSVDSEYYSSLSEALKRQPEKPTPTIPANLASLSTSNAADVLADLISTHPNLLSDSEFQTKLFSYSTDSISRFVSEHIHRFGNDGFNFLEKIIQDPSKSDFHNASLSALGKQAALSRHSNGSLSQENKNASLAAKEFLKSVATSSDPKERKLIATHIDEIPNGPQLAVALAKDPDPSIATELLNSLSMTFTHAEVMRDEDINYMKVLQRNILRRQDIQNKDKASFIVQSYLDDESFGKALAADQRIKSSALEDEVFKFILEPADDPSSSGPKLDDYYKPVAEYYAKNASSPEQREKFKQLLP